MNTLKALILSLPSPFPLFSLDVYNLKEDAAVFAGKRALISFLSWLDYCDQLIKEAQKVRNLSRLAELQQSRVRCSAVTLMATCFFTRETFFCVPSSVSSSSHGESRERKVLCVRHGAAADADVRLTHPSIILTILSWQPSLGMPRVESVR